MGRPLAITKRQAASLLKAAEEQQGIVEVQTAIGIIRLIPKSIVNDMDRGDDDVKGHF